MARTDFSHWGNHICAIIPGCRQETWGQQCLCLARFVQVLCWVFLGHEEGRREPGKDSSFLVSQPNGRFSRLAHTPSKCNMGPACMSYRTSARFPSLLLTFPRFAFSLNTFQTKHCSVCFQNSKPMYICVCSPLLFKGLSGPRLELQAEKVFQSFGFQN